MMTGELNTYHGNQGKGKERFIMMEIIVSYNNGQVEAFLAESFDSTVGDFLVIECNLDNVVFINKSQILRFQVNTGNDIYKKAPD